MRTNTQNLILAVVLVVLFMAAMNNLARPSNQPSWVDGDGRRLEIGESARTE